MQDAPSIKPQALQFDLDPDTGSDRHELGRGSVGVVYAGHYADQSVAIKTLYVTTDSVVEALYKEAALMFRLASSYTVKLHGICVSPQKTSLVMERMMGGSLFHLLQNKKADLPWSLRYRLAYEIAEGLWTLHSQEQEVLHRDLKSLNVLLDEHQHAKITDFGFSRVRGQISSVSASSKHSVGTPAYKAPEIVALDMAGGDDEEAEAADGKGSPYSPYSDIYAYGVILWELATREIPFAGKNPFAVFRALSQGKTEKIPADCPPEFAALIQACWEMRPADRPRTDEIVKRTQALYDAELARQMPVENAVDEKADAGAPAPNVQVIINADHANANNHGQIGPDISMAGRDLNIVHHHHHYYDYGRDQVNKAAPQYIPGPGMYNPPKAGPAPVMVVDIEEEKISEKEKQAFFRHIARGEQDEAEVMLKKMPSLAFAKGRFDDISDLRCLQPGDQFQRIFQDISGWQYAIWAGDIHMCLMMKRCFIQMPNAKFLIQTAKSQYLEVVGGQGDFAASRYGRQFDLTPLIVALNTYCVMLYNGWMPQQCEHQWCKVIGGLQRNLPAHVINEYCRPDRSFVVINGISLGPPDFLDATLPRKGYMLGNAEYGLDWWLLETIETIRSIGKIGATWAACRGPVSMQASWNRMPVIPQAVYDAPALGSLKARRSQQIEFLSGDLDACACMGAALSPSF